MEESGVPALLYVYGAQRSAYPRRHYARHGCGGGSNAMLRYEEEELRIRIRGARKV